ncbi:MAG: TIGR02186 family protein, partial [Geminicoccaceae bacterium]
AQAREDIQSDLSARDIKIESNFTGAEIVVFGTVENGTRSSAAGDYDVVVVIRGPDESIVTRRKARTLGLWMNRDSQVFEEVPGFYAVLSTRPLDEIAKPDILKRYDIGFDSLLPIPEATPNGDVQAFREAVIRIMQDEGLYVAEDRGVTFISNSLFRATIALPAHVPDGGYLANVYLFRDGKLLSLNQSQLSITKAGFERLIYSTAFDYPLIYGILAVLVAVVVGLFASAMLRRE